MKDSSHLKVIITCLVAIFITLGQTGCKRNNNPTGNSSAASDGASSTGTKDERINVPAQADAQGYVNQGDEYLKNDKDKEALESFRRAVELDKDFALGFLKMGLAYDALNQDEDADKAYKSAIEAYEKKLKSDSTHARDHYEVGRAYYRLGRYEDAARAFNQATKIEPENSDALFELGMAQFKMARYDAAIVALKKAIDLDPDNYRAVEALERAQDGQKRIAEMVKHQADELKKQKLKDEAANANGNANSNSSPGTKSKP